MTIIIYSYLHPTYPSHLNIPTHEVGAFVYNLKTTTEEGHWWDVSDIFMNQIKRHRSSNPQQSLIFVLVKGDTCQLKIVSIILTTLTTIISFQ